jgi:LPXTG-site transpeptidase (sortase) family protein
MVRHRTGVVIGGTFVALAVLGVAYPLWWGHRSSEAGHALLERALHVAATPRQVAHTCASAPKGVALSPSSPGVVEIPAINLQAPVLNGVGNAVLDVAVGHEPSSVRPGAAGESVLLAHDVSYFSAIGRLHVGDRVIWIDGCVKETFRVTGHEVTRPGATLAVPASGSGLALVTCWPTDALWWTPDRYVVETTLVQSAPVDHPAASPPVSSAGTLDVPKIPAARGLSYSRSSVIAGTLTVTGAPSASFTESPAPLNVANAVLSDVAAIEVAASHHNATWWSVLARPDVPLPAPWPVGTVEDVSLSVTGTRIAGATVRSSSGTISLTVRGSELVVDGVAASP